MLSAFQSFFRHFTGRAFLLIFLNCINGYTSDIPTAPVTVKLVSASTATGGQETLMLGAEFIMKSGWKIYAPPRLRIGTDPSTREPQFTWQPNSNVKKVEILWPKAFYQQENNLPISYYQGRIIIPIVVDIDKPDAPLHLAGDVKFIACSIQCIPMEIKLAIDLPAGMPQVTPYAQEIIDYEKEQNHRQSWSHISEDVSLLYMLLIAFLGGIILNFMPCVLPVISLKLKSLLQTQVIKQGGEKGTFKVYKANFVATIVGIITSFMTFAFIAIGLQSSGKLFGWGMHFQEPLFIIIMCGLMVILSANLWGIAEIQLPAFIQQPIYKILNTHTQKWQTFFEGFFSGIFATLLATPCTAPFLGTALGYALTQGSWIIILLFMALGVGFSMPYILGLVMPLHRLPLPKPGKWMKYLSQVLAVGLLVTTVWLLWILMNHIGPVLTSGIAVLLIAIIGILFVTPPYHWTRKFAWLAALGTIVIGVYAKDQAPNVFTINKTQGVWKPFSEQALSAALQANKIIVVDVTASWCTTCQLNKIFVLESEVIQKILSSDNIVALRADWTSHNPEIGQYLARHGRYGIPCNIIYGPRATQGLLLPELLTQESILQALEYVGYTYPTL